MRRDKGGEERRGELRRTVNRSLRSFVPSFLSVFAAAHPTARSARRRALFLLRRRRDPPPLPLPTLPLPLPLPLPLLLWTWPPTCFSAAVANPRPGPDVAFTSSRLLWALAVPKLPSPPLLLLWLRVLGSPSTLGPALSSSLLLQSRGASRDDGSGHARAKSTPGSLRTAISSRTSSKMSQKIMALDQQP